MWFNTENSIVQEVYPAFLNNTKKKLFIKRDDLIDELVSGNKWRKLYFNLEYVIRNKYEGVLTFGGAYSNHLLATASACSKVGLKSIGIVRGEELNNNSNNILKQCFSLGMQLKFVTRSDYDRRDEMEVQYAYKQLFNEYYLIPEGGANYFGLIGCQHILPECQRSFDQVFVAQGTSTTSCGILLSLNYKTKLNVVPVLKGYDGIEEMRHLLLGCSFEKEWVQENLKNVVVHGDAHFGGYGKYNATLLDFMERFFIETSIPIDPIYTGKALYALMKYCSQTHSNEEDILFVHTGGVCGGKAISYKENRKFS
jgi:1-aminocyclopropane-1-carboxylate deaminase